jgi:hypothetical protein
VTDIPRAREILDEWRVAARDAHWSIESDTDEGTRLARGTAANPTLLDAVDAVMGVVVYEPGVSRALDRAGEMIAEAIITANEGMTS